MEFQTCGMYARPFHNEVEIVGIIALVQNKLLQILGDSDAVFTLAGVVITAEIAVGAEHDMYELHYNEDPFHFLGKYQEKMMPEAGSSMVPRLMKTHVGDIFTTNMIADEDVALEDELSPRAEDGILSKSGDGSIVWQVVKIYTMPDGQPGVKLMRIK